MGYAIFRKGMCLFLKWDSPFSEKVSAFFRFASTLASNQSCPLVLLDGSDFFNGRLCRIYCKALIF